MRVQGWPGAAIGWFTVQDSSWIHNGSNAARYDCTYTASSQYKGWAIHPECGERGGVTWYDVAEIPSFRRLPFLERVNRRCVERGDCLIRACRDVRDGYRSIHPGGASRERVGSPRGRIGQTCEEIRTNSALCFNKKEPTAANLRTFEKITPHTGLV